MCSQVAVLSGSKPAPPLYSMKIYTHAFLRNKSSGTFTRCQPKFHSRKLQCFIEQGSLHKQSLCYSTNSLFSNLICKFCCDANIVATKCVHFESVYFFINKQLLSTANAKEFNTDYHITNSTLPSRYHGSVA